MFETLVMIVRTLDSLPDLFRAALCAAVLAFVAYRVGREIPGRLAGLTTAHRKTSLVVLLVVPVLVFTVPVFRFDITVDDLPQPLALPSLVAWPVLTVWLLGVLLHAVRAGMRVRSELMAVRVLQPANAELCQSLDHWQEQLGLRALVSLRLSEADRPQVTGWRKPIVALPGGATRWPKAVVDALIVQSLCHVRKHHWPWLVFGNFVSAAYWPFPWVTQQNTQLGHTFQERADSLAMACFRDTLGYARALQHVRQRLTPAAIQQDSANAPALLRWGDAASITRREAQAQRQDGDPHYDRIFWAMVQATFAAVLVAAPTLTETPEEIEYAPASDNWQEVIHRSPDRVDTPIERRR